MSLIHASRGQQKEPPRELRPCPKIIESTMRTGQGLSSCFERQLCRRADALICRRCLIRQRPTLPRAARRARHVRDRQRLLRQGPLPPQPLHRPPNHRSGHLYILYKSRHSSVNAVTQLRREITGYPSSSRVQCQLFTPRTARPASRRPGGQSRLGHRRELRQRRQISASARRQSCRSKQELRPCPIRMIDSIIFGQGLTGDATPHPRSASNWPAEK